MPPKSLIIGSTGFIGSSFSQKLPGLIHTARTGKYAVDLRDLELNFSVEGYRWAICSCGYATPRRATENPELCWQIDFDGMIKLCRLFKEKGIVPILFSTSHVFDGSLPIYTADSEPSPVNLYGEIHAKREQLLMQEMADDILILRLSRVYGEGHNIIQEIANCLISEEKVAAATDQVLQLLPVEEMMDALFWLQEQNARGIYQICPEESVTRYELACYIAKRLGLDPACVKPICMSDIDDIPRPKCAHMASCYQVSSWKEGVEQVVKQCRARVLEKC